MTKIVELKSSDRDGSFSIKQTDKNCQHKYVEIDADEREVRCQNCNAIVDPFEYVLGMAYEENSQMQYKKWLKREVEMLEKQKQDIIKEITNLKAQKRRLNA